MKTALSPALELLALTAALAANETKPAFTAAMTHEADKATIQKLREQYDVTEKTFMGLLLRNADLEQLEASANEYKAAELAAKEAAKLNKVASKEELEAAKKQAKEAAAAEKAAKKAKEAAEKAANKAAAAAAASKEKLEAVVESRRGKEEKEKAPEKTPA